MPKSSMAEHNEEQQAARRQADHAQPRRVVAPGSGAQPAPGGAALLFYLQHAAGNQAVNRLLQRQAAVAVRREHDQAEEPEVGLEGGPISEGLSDRINANRGSGSALDDTVRTQMEDAFGAPLDAVRVHSDGESHALNRRVSARAFTIGSDIFLGADAGPDDTHLMAHELTHVVQQQGGEPGGPLMVGAADDAHEQEAEAASQLIARSVDPWPSPDQPLVASAAQAMDLSSALQRDPDDDRSWWRPTPPSTPDTPPAVPPDPNAHRVAVTLWHDSVVEPLVTAQEEVTKGPAHFTTARSNAGNTLGAIKAVEHTFAGQPLARQRIAEFLAMIELVVADFAATEHEPVSGTFIGEVVTEAIYEAALIGPSLDAGTKAQPAGKAPSANAAPGLWDVQVVKPLQGMQRNYLALDPTSEDYEHFLQGYASVDLSRLNSIKTIVDDVTFSFQGDEVGTRKLVTLALKVDRLIALAAGAAHKTVQPGDGSHWLDKATRQARNLEHQLTDGSLDQPAPTPAATGTP